MHVAFALMIGIPLARLVKWRALKVFWAMYPLLVVFVIVATANHFIADAVLGALRRRHRRARRPRARPHAAARVDVPAGAAPSCTSNATASVLMAARTAASGHRPRVAAGSARRERAPAGSRAPRASTATSSSSRA